MARIGAPALRSGMMRETVRLARNSPVADALGGQAENWVEIRAFRANVRAVGGQEVNVALGLKPLTTWLVVARHWWTDPPRASDRLLWKGKELEISGTPEDVDELHRWWRITATELA